MRLRVRELKKDYFFGNVLRHNERVLPKLSSENLVCQFLDVEEDL
jgi:hypothetical protein